MEEILFGLFVAFFEVFAEFLLEVAGEAFFSLLWRGFSRLFPKPQALNSVLTTIEFVLFGLMAGWVTVVLFPHPLVRPSRIHGISLLISPLMAGSVMSFVGSSLRRKGKRTTQIESFGYGFAFALAMALIRFLFVK